MVNPLVMGGVLAMGLVTPGHAGGPGEPSLCSAISTGGSNVGRRIQIDAVFTSDALEHSYLLLPKCARHKLIEITSDASGGRHGSSLFWALAKARRHSRPGHWFGVAARARVRLVNHGEAWAVEVEAIMSPKLVRIAPPASPPPR